MPPHPTLFRQRLCHNGRERDQVVEAASVMLRFFEAIFHAGGNLRLQISITTQPSRGEGDYIETVSREDFVIKFEEFAGK